MPALSSIPSVLRLVKQEKDPMFTTFAELYLSALEEDDLTPYEPSETLKILQELWQFMQVRTPGTTNIVLSSPLNRKVDWESKKTSIFLVTKDRPFLIDSVAAEIMRNDLRIVTLMHPTLSISRNKDTNKLEQINDASHKEGTHETILFVEVEGSLNKEQCSALKSNILGVLDDVRFATNDWLDMKAKVLHTMGDIQKSSAYLGQDLQKFVDFLKYIHDDNFTLLGYREYEFTRKKKEIISKIVEGSGLGLLRDEKQPAYITDRRSPLPKEFQQLRVEQDTITLTKVSRNSTVHRPVPMDGIHIKIYSDKGEVIGERLFIGLFTSVTYSRSVRDVPLLRDKVEGIIKQCNFTPNSHDYKALTHIMEKYPRDELFQITQDQLSKFVSSILRLQERPRIALYTREDPFKRYISCLVYIPRDLYSTNIRETFQDILSEELDGHCDTFYTTLDDSPLARVLFIVKTKQNVEQKVNTDALEQKLIQAGRPWDEKLLQAFIYEKGEIEDSFKLSQIYGKAFPIGYTEHFTPNQAVADIELIEKVYKTGEIAHSLYRPKGMDKCQLRLKIYSPEHPITLSDIIPIMENMGLKVESELPFEITPAGRDGVVWVHDMHMQSEEQGCVVKISDVKDIFEDALHQIWYKKCDDDRMNALILTAQLTWRDVVIIRSYKKYLRQSKFPFTPDYIIKALTDHPHIASLLVEWFKAKHDPSQAPVDNKTSLRVKDKELQKINKTFHSRLSEALNNVSSLDQDRILRSFGILIENTLRTNFFQTQKNGEFKDFMSLKFHSKKINFLPNPKPAYEVFVYSPRMEGVHLRGGKIARGGIRWSDRHEDFRTEILGLMKAQTVKNSVIVPVGAKGGFIVKNPPKEGGRDALQKEAIECYKYLIRGLLDITDNLRGKKITPPKSVVRLDEDDPYLVVAADKGTATFSDIANSVSKDYGFWLSDAFASGGSAGYDHKAMGITARGAWESVKRHFRELGHNIQEDDFDVIGVGDMGGDVFGNGMLLSEKIRLVGAFNHLHIFCDPNPDPKKSFKERQRLFDKVKGWDEYNEKLLSKGGRIYNRNDKSLKLTKEIQTRFDIKDDEVSPIELMNAMLKAKADLLWFGGIGTYIKSDKESHLDVGDKANDAIRVNANEVRARVIGEGANLGVTQDARIDMAMNDVKLNADFIDNSGGVDCSDHEVNIKIMMAQYMQNNPDKLSMEKRNKLLEDMTENVANLVLENNYQQSQAISLTEKTAIEDLRSHSQFISELERHDGLNRKLESLPDDEEITTRIKKQKGLTRPELATIIAYSKIRLYNDLLNSTVPDNEAFNDWLTTYFPEALQKTYKDPILEHKLRREIVATRLTNAIVNRYGPTMIMNLVQKSDSSPHIAARACFFVRETYAFKQLWTQIEELDNKIDADAQLNAILDIKVLTEHATLWFLKRGILDCDDPITDISKKYRDGFKALIEILLDDKKLPKGAAQIMQDKEKSYIKQNMPKELATKIAVLPLLKSNCDITYWADKTGESIRDVADIYYKIGDKLNIYWLQQKTSSIFAGNKWQEQVKETIQDELYDIHAQICGSILNEFKKTKHNDKIGAWLEKHAQGIEAAQKMMSEMRGHTSLDLSMLTMAEQRLRRLATAE